jgi:hypothetical protein
MPGLILAFPGRQILTLGRSYKNRTDIGSCATGNVSAEAFCAEFHKPLSAERAHVPELTDQAHALAQLGAGK